MAYAQSGTVRKVKGKSAIIRFDERPDFRKGERVSLGGGSSSMSMGGASRNYSLALSFAYEQATVDVGFGDSDIDSLEMTPILMINKGRFEFGGGLSYLSTDSNGSEETQYTLMGLGEYNFVENKPGVKFVPSIQGSIGVANYESGSQSGNGLSYGIGGRLKVFPWNDSFALVAAFGLTSSTIDIGNGLERERSSTRLAAGIQGYF